MRSIQSKYLRGTEVASMVDTVELEDWTDKATVLGVPVFHMSDSGIVEIFDQPEPIVELSPGRNSDEAILDLHED